MIKAIAVFMYFCIITLAYAYSGAINAALLDTDKQDLNAVSIIKNGGFEDGKGRWTASGGTFATVTSGTNLLTGKVSATWDSGSASQTLTSTAVAIPKGLYGQNGMLQCRIQVPSGTATHTIQAYDGSNTLASATITSSTSPTHTQVNFIFPSSGNIQLRLTSVASDEPLIAIDDCWLGDAINITAATPQDVFSAKIDTSAVVTAENAEWITSDCVKSGTNSSTTTCTISGFTATPNCTCSVNGSSNSNQTCFYNVSGSSSTSAVFVTQTNGAFSNLALNVSCQKTGVDAARQSLTAGTSAMSWSGYHDKTCSWARTNTAYGDPTADATCTFTQNSNQNFGTVASVLSAGNKLPGVEWTASAARKYLTCATFAFQAGTSVEAGLQIIDQSGNSLNELKMEHVSGAEEQFTLCGLAQGITGTNYVKMQTKSASGSSTINSSGLNYVSWTIVAIDQQMPAPLLVNSVVNPRSGVTQVVSAYITNSGTPTVTSQDGSWISSLTDNGAGDMTLNIAAGTFSATPRCVCTAHSAAGAESMCVQDTTTAQTSTAIRLRTATSGGTDFDQPLNVICVGAK